MGQKAATTDAYIANAPEYARPILKKIRTLMHKADPKAFLEMVRKVVDNPAVEVAFTARDTRPKGPITRLDSEPFKIIEQSVSEHYDGAITLPTMSTGATDMAYLRAKGMQCYGIGPATDIEDGPKGFGAHSDQERILESELHRFVRFLWDVVTKTAGAR